MSRSTAVAAALVALTLLAAACGGSTPDGGELVWAVSSTETRAVSETAEMWNRLHPHGPKVRIETLPPIHRRSASAAER